MKPNQIWVSDITLFRMNSRDYYICAYMDAYSRRIVSYTIGRSASTHLVKMALIRACSVRKPKKGLIIHTDGGAQYDSWSMRREYLKRHIRHSISRPGTPTDNPLMESFYSRLKSELLNVYFFRSEAELYEKLADYIHKDLSPTKEDKEDEFAMQQTAKKRMMASRNLLRPVVKVRRATRKEIRRLEKGMELDPPKEGFYPVKDEMAKVINDVTGASWFFRFNRIAYRTWEN